ncbi:hypothetical protein CRYUN_Cryun29cG0097900 [Craigia yunnanensis]
MSSAEDQMQQLRSKATELLLREEWKESVQLYSRLIDLYQDQISKTPDLDHLFKLHKSLCVAFSNQAEARSRLQDFTEALKDCDQAFQIEATHFKTSLCKGKILFSLNRYSNALDCFKAALFDPQGNGNLEILNCYLENCKKLEFQSRTGSFDLSDWVLNGFRGKPPELAEYIGPVQVKRSESEISGRGLFATKDIDAGTLFLVTKAIAIERGILGGEVSGKNAQLVMWKNFIDKVKEAVTKCQKTQLLINMLSTGENEEGLEVPDMSFFRPEIEKSGCSKEKLDMDKLLSILDVNSLVEEAVSARVGGRYEEMGGEGKREGLLEGIVLGSAYSEVYGSDRLMKQWSRRIPSMEVVTDSVVEVVGSDERVLKVVVEG